MGLEILGACGKRSRTRQRQDYTNGAEVTVEKSAEWEMGREVAASYTINLDVAAGSRRSRLRRPLAPLPDTAGALTWLEANRASRSVGAEPAMHGA
jgi:hypothetical protein